MTLCCALRPTHVHRFLLALLQQPTPATNCLVGFAGPRLFLDVAKLLGSTCCTGNRTGEDQSDLVVMREQCLQLLIGLAASGQPSAICGLSSA